MKIAYKVWIDHYGKAFGDGPCELLKRVERTKSLHRAAAEMGMAYSKAWHLIRTIEKRLGFILLERRVGGLSGGGSKITPEAKELMIRYEGFQRDVRSEMEKIFKRHFGLYSHKEQKRRS